MFQNTTAPVPESKRIPANPDTRVSTPPPVVAVATRGGLAPWQIRRVTEYIEDHLASTIRLQDLANIARLSHSHFCRAFKESMGHPAHAYVMRRRVHRAQGLMLTTPESLSQIAALCGMADQAHFCKLFRRLVGESPNAWRRPRRQPAAAPP
jgi:transcriptional regulator GlxA family with amidase domain